ncbi:hypothetical protein [Sandaracinus amylolyticus]|uniref:Uncharacterized protein n=1 Tax=Sandaracinus amylolyticus TaxID=927083 RepID=A0A0F6YEZ5_9BACT|nr:hypothetical protein [Sandaracinus amylolyticus]AKF03038.1 hypothetical protein DB32_000187 [Sandaracinus amylolyticus]
MTSIDTRSKSIAIALLALALGGCGDGPPARVPATITVRAEPARLWFHSDQEVVVAATVTDATGEELEAPTLVWTAEPASSVTAGAPDADPRRARFTLTTPGATTVTGCVAPAREGDEPTLCSSIVLRVDDGMPSLELETPAPGAELDDPSGIVVRGSVADRGVVRVYVNGVGVTPDDVGAFETTVPATFGVTHLAVDASDGLTEVSHVEMDVLWAPAFLPATSEDGLPALTLTDGLALRLGSAFFDDGLALDATTSPILTRDLADLLELVVTRLDVSSLVPDPVIDSPPTFTLRVTDVTLGDPRAELAITDEGVDLFLRIGAIEASTSGALTFEGESLPLDGVLRASAVAHARLTVRKESEDAEIVVEMGELEVAIESATGDFTSDETDAVFLLAEGVLRRTLEDTLGDAVHETVASSVPAVLRDALSAIDGALAGQSFSLDSAPFPPITISIDGGMRALDTTFEREMLATLRTSIGTNVASVHPETRGVAQLDASAMTPAFFRDGSIALGVRLELLNGLLHGLWSSGLLDLDVTPLLPEAVTTLVSEAHLEGRLPPVLRPPASDEGDDLVLGVGQLELALVFQGEPARFAVRIDAGVRVDVIDNRIAIDVAETPEITVWTLVPPSNPRLLTPDIVRNLLLDLWPDLRASLTSGLALELPLPAVGDLGGLAPDLAALTLELEMNGRLRPRGGVLVLDAQLVGTLPVE